MEYQKVCAVKSELKVSKKRWFFCKTCAPSPGNESEGRLMAIGQLCTDIHDQAKNNPNFMSLSITGGYLEAKQMPLPP